MHYERPYLVGLVCWVLILGNMAELVLTMKKLGTKLLTEALAIYPYPPEVAGTILFGSMGVLVVLGILMYERQGWARYVYVVAMLPSLAQNYLAVPAQKVPENAMIILGVKVALYLISIVLIFLPAARRFYHPPKYLDGYE